jgi:signal peptidase II
LILGLAGLVVVADQLTKSWALHHAAGYHHVVGTLWFTLTFNSGAAFGLGQGVTPVLEVVAAVLVAVLVVASRRASRGAPAAIAVGIGLLLGGAVSNLADRLFRTIPGHPGAVVDFIDIARVGTHDWWPIFNVADAAITIGALTLVVAFSRSRAPVPPSG